MTLNRSEEVRARDYTEGACWYGIKFGKRDTVPCNIDARLYRVERARSDTGFGFRTIPSNNMSMEVWLCEKHKQKMVDDGFTLHLILR